MSDTAEAGDSPVLHEGSYPYLQTRVLVHLRGVTTYPEVIRSLSPRKGEISAKNRTGPPGTLASSQQQAARALALLLLSTLPIQVV